MRSKAMKKRERWSVETIDLTTKRAKEEKEEKGFAAWFRKYRKRIFIIVGVVYAAALLFGIFSTRFYYDENGNRRAYMMTFSDYKAQDDYNTREEKFSDIRDLLTDITIIDIHVANGDYTNYEAATMYTSILNGDLDVLIPKISALDVQEEQKTLQEEMQSILSYDLALYLQNMSAGLKSGSNDTVSTALSYRDKAFATYEIIQTDMKTLAERIKIDDSAYYNWLLQDAVTAKDKTAVLRESEESNGQ